MNEIITGDCIEVMRGLPAGSVDLVFADPPFNIGYQYDVYGDKRKRDEYLDWTRDWIALAAKLLKPSGSIFVAIGDEYAAEVKQIIDGCSLTMRNWIIWYYTFGVACQTKFSRSHAHIFYHVADLKRCTFNADAVRVPSDRQLKYADKRARPGGKLPDDVWQFSRVCGTFKERTGHPCQMPETILERIIKVASNPGDVVFDPFVGSGTTPAVAKRLGRRWLGCELSADYAEAARKRIAAVNSPEEGSYDRLAVQGVRESTTIGATSDWHDASDPRLACFAGAVGKDRDH